MKIALVNGEVSNTEALCQRCTWVYSCQGWNFLRAAESSELISKHMQTINNVLGFEKNLEKVSTGKYGFEFFQWILEPASIVGSFLTSLCPDLAQVAPSPAMDYNWWHLLQQRRHSEGHAEIGVLTVINTQVGIESMMERNDRWRQTLTTKELIG